jgi:hypothetical protein
MMPSPRTPPCETTPSPLEPPDGLMHANGLPAVPLVLGEEADVVERPYRVFPSAAGRNPFVTCDGREDEPSRMRQVRFSILAPFA